MNIAERILIQRKQKGWSQEQLAEELGVSRQAVSKWEMGDSMPDMEKVVALSQVFAVTTDYLLKGEAGMQDTGNSSGQKENNSAVFTAEKASGGNREPVYNERKHGKSRYTDFGEYEYISKKTICGLPLVHIHYGRKICKAKGIIAIGNVAVGVVAVGGISCGLVSVGGLAAGGLAVGGLGAGLAAVGGLAVGLLAAGGIAVGGVLAVGGLAVGQYAVGGCAFGMKAAFGDYASGHIAVGNSPKGTICFLLEDVKGTGGEQVKNAILSEFPKTWKWIADLFSFIVNHS